MNGNRLQHRASPSTRQGFTLIELLIVVAVIAVMVSIVSLALLSVQEQIRQDRSKETIVKLNALVMAKWESFKTRRIALPPAAAFSGTQQTRELALARLDYLRELMRMEMPDRFSDIIDGPVLPDPAQISGTYASWDVLYRSGITPVQRPAAQQAYLNFLRSRGVTTQANVVNNVHTNQNAECLFLLVTMGLEESRARELFSEDEIGDTDGDGFPEFLDAWGRPIRFLRWAPGFASDPTQSGYQFLSALQTSEGLASSSTKDPDPFDAMRVDTRDPTNFAVRVAPSTTNARFVNYALYPLIYSAGKDGAYGIVDGVIVSPDLLATPPLVRYSQTSAAAGVPPNNPYFIFASLGVPLGTPIKRIATSFQGNDFSSPDRPTTSVIDYVSQLPGDEPFGDFADNLHNHLQPMNR